MYHIEDEKKTIDRISIRYREHRHTQEIEILLMIEHNLLMISFFLFDSSSLSNLAFFNNIYILVKYRSRLLLKIKLKDTFILNNFILTSFLSKVRRYVVEHF